MQELLQNLLQDVPPAQAWGIWLLRSTLKLGYPFLSFFYFLSPETTNKPPHHHLSLFLNFLQAQGRCQPPKQRERGVWVCSQICRLLFYFILFFYSTTSPFHFIVRKSAQHSLASRLNQCSCDCNQCWALWNHVLNLPVPFMHFSCMFRKFPSQSYLQCLYHRLSMAVIHFFFFFMQAVPKGALWLAAWV